MCHKAVKRYFFVFDSIPNRYKTQEMCDKVVSKAPFLIVYWPYKYKTLRICDKAIDDCLAALKFIPDWFVTSKMIKKFLNALYYFVWVLLKQPKTFRKPHFTGN